MYKANKTKCKHPGLGRRVVAQFSIFGEGFAIMLVKLGVFIQKIGNALRFEHFWNERVSNKDNPIILPSFTKVQSKHAIWDIAIQHVKQLGESGTILEFGTNNGGSLYYFWKNLPNSFKLHGFDCFEGLPESWDSLPKGSIKGNGYPSELWRDDLEQQKIAAEYVKTTGLIPPVPQENIKIHKGLFAHTVPALVNNGINNIHLIHFDADIYIWGRVQ